MVTLACQWHQSRRGRASMDGRFTSVAAAKIAVLAFLIGLPLSGPALAITGGSPYTVDEVVDTNPDPNIVETTLVAEETTVDMGLGRMVHAQTFNGKIPGPLFRLKVGDTVIVHFRNNMDHVSGIHWHGIELNNASDGTPLTQNQVPFNMNPGSTREFLYKFKVTRPGIYWYHPHHHASTNQLFRGLYGPIIVEERAGPEEETCEEQLQTDGVIPSSAQTLVLALSDVTVCKDAPDNDAETYCTTCCECSETCNDTWAPLNCLPWAGNPGGGPPMPAQANPTPKILCEGGTVGNTTYPIDDEGNTRCPCDPYVSGDIPSIQTTAAGRVNEGQTVLTNGVNVGHRAGWPAAPGALAGNAIVYNVLAGQGLRLQIGNSATIRFFRLRLTNAAGAQIPLVRIGGQGGLLNKAVLDGGIVGGFNFKYDSGEILLDPGDRADVVAAIPANTPVDSVLTLWTLDFQRTGDTGGWAKIATVPVAHFKVTGQAGGNPYTITAGTALLTGCGVSADLLGPACCTLLDPSTFNPAKPGMANPEIQLTNPGNTLGINGIQGAHDFPGDYTGVPHFGSARYAKLGDTLELTVKNAVSPGSHHPFHLHGFSIQPKKLEKANSPTYTFDEQNPEFKDNQDVPAGYTLTYRVRLDDRPMMDGVTMGGGLGRWMFHCHIFHHASFGMISEFVVLDPNGNEKPTINANYPSVQVDECQNPTMFGTYNDPDGDPVTLTLEPPAIGTLTDFGCGVCGWMWTYDATNGPWQSQFIYVTITDSHGLKDQVSFFLKAPNDCDDFDPCTADMCDPQTGCFYTGTRTVVGRKLFYKNSFFDHPSTACNSLVGQVCDDNTAIASDKLALKPGDTAIVSSYSSYSRGINGLMIDVNPVQGCSALPAGPLSASNFDFQVGNSANLADYVDAAAPTSIEVIPGGGTIGSDRIKIIWSDNAIPNTNWLRVVVKSNASGGSIDMAADDVFYFGLAIGESLTPGATRAIVNSTDEIDARNHAHNSLKRVPVATNSPYAVANAPDSKYDYDKSSLVSSTDEIIARNNPTNALNGLLLLNPAP